MTLDPRDRVPCSGGHFGVARGLWAEHGDELLDRWGLHRPVYDCIPMAQLESERAALCRRLEVQPP